MVKIVMPYVERLCRSNFFNYVHFTGIPNPCHQIIDRPMLHQAYKLFEQLGPNGESQRKFGMLLGVPRLEGRAICRNLKRLGVVSIIMKDAGRQRVTQ